MDIDDHGGSVMRQAPVDQSRNTDERTRRLTVPAFRRIVACMNLTRSTQYTLRQIPRAVDECLRRKAREEGKSLNQTAVEVLIAGLALSGDGVVHRDLDFLVGTWIEDPAFDAAMQAQDQVDPLLWR
ncbi:MAG: hypothetical protein KJ072_19485 [Verrucomicrobia bacterium]|nr:hypothetical protein [Verrucomicrobiota bacterium]